MTIFLNARGAPVIDFRAVIGKVLFDQTSSPVFASKAINRPSVAPTNTFPFKYATPRFVFQPWLFFGGFLCRFLDHRSKVIGPCGHQQLSRSPYHQKIEDTFNSQRGAHKLNSIRNIKLPINFQLRDVFECYLFKRTIALLIILVSIRQPVYIFLDSVLTC